VSTSTAQTTNLHELRMINAAWKGPQGDGWGDLYRSGIRPEMLQSGECQSVYAWAIKKHRDFNAWPSETLTKQNFPNVRRIKVADPLDSLISEFKSYYRAVLMQEALEEAIAEHAARNFDAVLDRLRQGVSQVDAFSRDDTTAIRSGDEEVFRKIMEENASRDGTEVLPTGFKTIDETLNGGLRRGQLDVVIAPTKAGKTTLALQIAISAQREGRKVVFQTYELSERQVYLKYLSQKLQIPPKRLDDGKLKSPHMRKVDQMLDDHESGKLQDIVFVSSIRDVDTAAVTAEEEKPDLLVIDGAYMMEVAEKENRTNSLEQMLRSLKALALSRDIAVLVTTQALESKMSGTRLKQTSAAHSSAWGQYADVMLGLEMINDSDGNPEPDQRNLRILLNRFGDVDEVNLEWDWHQLVFEEM